MEKEMTKDEIEAAEKARELGLPATLEEACEMATKNPSDYEAIVRIDWYSSDNMVGTRTQCTTKTTEEAKAFQAFAQLSKLRDMYRKGWKPDWNDKTVKHVIKVSGDSPIIYGDFCVRNFLSFPDELTAYLFYENFKDLIWKAKDLI